MSDKHMVSDRIDDYQRGIHDRSNRGLPEDAPPASPADETRRGSPRIPILPTKAILKPGERLEIGRPQVFDPGIARTESVPSEAVGYRLLKVFKNGKRVRQYREFIYAAPKPDVVSAAAQPAQTSKEVRSTGDRLGHQRKKRSARAPRPGIFGSDLPKKEKPETKDEKEKRRVLELIDSLRRKQKEFDRKTLNYPELTWTDDPDFWYEEYKEFLRQKQGGPSEVVIERMATYFRQFLDVFTNTAMFHLFFDAMYENEGDADLVRLGNLIEFIDKLTDSPIFAYIHFRNTLVGRSAAFKTGPSQAYNSVKKYIRDFFYPTQEDFEEAFSSASL